MFHLLCVRTNVVCVTYNTRNAFGICPVCFISPKTVVGISIWFVAEAVLQGRRPSRIDMRNSPHPWRANFDVYSARVLSTTDLLSHLISVVSYDSNLSLGVPTAAIVVDCCWCPSYCGLEDGAMYSKSIGAQLQSLGEP